MSVLVLILDPIRGVAMDELVEVRPLLQILLELHSKTQNKKRHFKTHRFQRGGLGCLLWPLITYRVAPARGGGRGGVAALAEV